MMMMLKFFEHIYNTITSIISMSSSLCHLQMLHNICIGYRYSSRSSPLAYHVWCHSLFQKINNWDQQKLCRCTTLKNTRSNRQNAIFYKFAQQDSDDKICNRMATFTAHGRKTLVLVFRKKPL